MSETFNSRDRVIWRRMNRKDFKYREKHGIYVGLVRYRPGGLHGPLEYDPNRALCRFDGNRGFSKVPIRELRKEN